MDSFQQALLNVEIARLRTEYRSTTSLPVEIRAAMLYTNPLCVPTVALPIVPTFYPVYPIGLYPYNNPFCVAARYW